MHKLIPVNFLKKYTKKGIPGVINGNHKKPHPLHPKTPIQMEKIAVKLILASSALVLCISVYKLVTDLV
jgi:hypothetical protein